MNQIHVPSNLPANNTIVDLSKVLAKLEEAHRSTPTRVGNLMNSVDDINKIKCFDGSDALIEGLYKGPHVAMCLLHMHPNSVIQNHFHRSTSEDSYEIVYCIKGSMNVQMNNAEGVSEVFHINEKGLLVIPPGEPHSAQCDESSILLCITIPADVDYPDYVDAGAIIGG